MEIKAISTVYNGIRFRSRLEARWAVFFDKLGIEYLYEFEGYQLPSGWYLPDFYLPHIDSFVEIKPEPEPEKERWGSLASKKCGELAMLTQKKVYLQNGRPYVYDDGCFIEELNSARLHYYRSDWKTIKDCFDYGLDDYYVWCQCPVCGNYGLTFDGRGARVCGDKCLPNDDKAYNHDTPALRNAVTVANRYQFRF